MTPEDIERAKKVIERILPGWEFTVEETEQRTYFRNEEMQFYYESSYAWWTCIIWHPMYLYISNPSLAFCCYTIRAFLKYQQGEQKLKAAVNGGTI